MGFKIVSFDELSRSRKTTLSHLYLFSDVFEVKTVWNLKQKGKKMKTW